MSRSTALVLPLLLALCVAVIVVAYRQIEADRAALVNQFAGARLEQVEEAARAITHELDDIPEDLRVAAELVASSPSGGEHARELRALQQAVTPYKAIGIFGEDGREDVLIVDPTAGLDVYRSTPVLAQTARGALERPLGELETSPPVERSAWLRGFATPIPNPEGTRRRAVAVLVDLEPYFAALKLIGHTPQARLLLLGAHGRPTSASDPVLAAALRAHDETPAAGAAGAQLFARMRAGERGVIRIPAAEARALGLGEADHVAAFAPIQQAGGAHWAIASVSEYGDLSTLQRSVAMRVATAAGLVILLLVVSALWAVAAVRRAAALRESQRHLTRLGHILDHLPTSVLALTADLRVARVNLALTRRSPSARPGVALTEAFASAPAGAVDRIVELVQAALSSGRAKSLPGEELALFGAPGHLSLHAVPLAHPDPELAALLVIDDLSNVHALESQLMRAEKLATVGVLAAGIAHEIGTPLGIVRGRAEYLLGKLEQDGPHARSLEVIIDQIDQVSRTIRQLLDFSRIQPAAVRPVDVRACAREVEELVRMEAMRQKVSLSVDVPEDAPPIAADPDQLQQALVNLLLNAFAACEGGGEVALVARMEAATPDGLAGRMRLSVIDDGPGIPKELRAHVFDPFFTTKKRGRGTGLGLAVVAQITRNHGAQIELDCPPQGGTVVTLWWPLSRSEVRHATA